MIIMNLDGSAIFIGNDGVSQHVGPTGTVAIDTAYALFQLQHSPPAAAPEIILALPKKDPGIPGALFLINNTLFVSQGVTAGIVSQGYTGQVINPIAIQVSATGPTGTVTQAV